MLGRTRLSLGVCTKPWQFATTTPGWTGRVSRPPPSGWLSKSSDRRRRSFLYWLARLLGDINAVQKGQVGRRIARRLAGRGRVSFSVGCSDNGQRWRSRWSSLGSQPLATRNRSQGEGARPGPSGRRRSGTGHGPGSGSSAVRSKISWTSLSPQDRSAHWVPAERLWRFRVRANHGACLPRRLAAPRAGWARPG
jgi:hypothetical protein